MLETTMMIQQRTIFNEDIAKQIINPLFFVL